VTPRTEYAELVSRAKNLGSNVLLLLLSFALLIVSAGTAFCTVWITLFRAWRGIIDRQTVRISGWKGDVLNVS
jgi:hypothetical protein